MDTAMGRRVFVGSVVAGLPLLATSAARAFSQAATAAGHAQDSAAADPVLVATKATKTN